MEIDTCEKYIIAELEDKIRECERLSSENKELAQTIDRLTKEPGRIERYVYEKGRRSVFLEFTGYPPSALDDCGNAMPIEAFAQKIVISGLLPSWISKDEFISYFSKEIQEIYEKSVAEERSA